MERIQRALDVARLQGSAATEAEPLAAATPVARVPRADVSASPSAAAPHLVTPGAPYTVSAPATIAHTGTPHLVAAEPSRPLPRYTMQTAGLRERRVLLADDPGPAARAYRMLRAQLLQRARSGAMRVFGIASAVSGEGKTVTAVNLALTLAAEPNQSVALLDFDLRHPSIARTLGIAPEYGLDTWLTSDLGAARVMCEIEGIPRLQVAPTLAPLGASSETLAGGRARALLEELRAADERRLLILDLPPALLSDDVLTVAPLVDGFIFVVTEGRTRREDVERVIELVGRRKIVGTVLNGSSDSEQRAY
jgi:protein-tyrosine kinase